MTITQVTVTTMGDMRRVVAINNQQEIGWFFGFTPRRPHRTPRRMVMCCGALRPITPFCFKPWLDGKFGWKIHLWKIYFWNACLSNITLKKNTFQIWTACSSSFCSHPWLGGKIGWKPLKNHWTAPLFLVGALITITRWEHSQWRMKPEKNTMIKGQTWVMWEV